MCIGETGRSMETHLFERYSCPNGGLPTYLVYFPTLTCFPSEEFGSFDQITFVYNSELLNGLLWP